MSTAARPLQGVTSQTVMRGASLTCSADPSGPSNVRSGVVNAMTIDVEDYFQVEALLRLLTARTGIDCRNGLSATLNAFLTFSRRPGLRRLSLCWVGSASVTPVWFGGSLPTDTNWQVTDLIISGLIGCRSRPFAPTCTKASVSSKIAVA